jgi:hypothetical protein
MRDYCHAVDYETGSSEARSLTMAEPGGFDLDVGV